MRNFILIPFIGLVAFACSQQAAPAPAVVATETETSKTEKSAWNDAIAAMERRAGFLDLYIDKKSGKVFAAFPTPDETGLSLRSIYSSGLSAGLGSNPIGLDRGLFDEGAIVAFRRVGGKLIAEQENWNYRASADNPLEKKAVRQSFAPSFIWSGEITSESPDGAMLVDLSSFLTRDALDVRGVLKSNDSGGVFSIAEDRTFPDPDQALAFPDNVEFDAYFTLTSDEPKSEVVATAANARSFTVIQHHSLSRLPDNGFLPRVFDQRAGAIDIPFYDFSAPLTSEVRQVYARRFRLEKQDPAAASSAAKEPIVFYVDSGAPEQIRDALIEGASWWADAFAAAGFPDSFHVEVLPEDAHPRDIRYNTISWTHRQTRGWSYGGGVYDPRTGEMIKASVILGSQRVRQDRMIFEGLAGAGKTGAGSDDDPVEIALDRIRQLSAHEVGHTLGFAHNFAASSNDRASVMDYPAPHVTVTEDGSIDFSAAYDQKIGAWDKLAATWLYAEFAADADDSIELDKILRQGYGSGLRFVGDREARSFGTGHPFASVWDNGEDAVAALEETLRVRRVALDNFGARSLKHGQPIADLNKIIVPIYLYHRYQIGAAAKFVGGYEFNYGLKGDGLPAARVVPPDEQRRALTALLRTLDPASLDLPDALLNRLTPQLGTFGPLSGGGETFDGGAGPVFDLIGAADTSAGITIRALLHPTRAARLIEQHRRNQAALSLMEVLGAIETSVFAPPSTQRYQRIAHAVQTRFVSSVIDLAVNEEASPAVQAEAEVALKQLQARLSPGFLSGPTSDRAHREWLVRRIESHLNRPSAPRAGTIQTPETPPGSPIGDEVMETCWHCDSVIQ